MGVNKMGYFEPKVNQFLEQFNCMYENEIPQITQMKNTKCNIETVPYFRERFIQVSEHLLTQIQGIAHVFNHSVVATDSFQILSKKNSQSAIDIKPTDDIYKRQGPPMKHIIIFQGQWENTF